MKVVLPEPAMPMQTMATGESEDVVEDILAGGIEGGVGLVLG